MLQRLLKDRMYVILASILLLVLVFALIYPTQFFSFDNLRQVLLNLSIDAIVAVGMMLLMIMGGFDLSVGSVLAFAGGLCAWLMFFQHWQVFPAVVVALTAAGAIGFINGLLVAYAGINPLIQTLAMMGIVRGLALMVSGAGIQGLPYWFNAIGQSRLLGLQMPVWYMLFIVAVFSFLFSRTVFFRKYYFIGNNEKAALVSGIPVRKMTCMAFIISALLAGFAGILLTSRLGAAMSTSGEGLELRVITAVILGGASLKGGAGKIPGALLGVIFMGLAANIMTISRVSGYWQQIIMGIILILAICTDLLFKKERS